MHGTPDKPKRKPFHILGHLTSRIGQDVTFSAPADVIQLGGTEIHGRIVDEVWADPALNVSPPRPSRGNSDWGDYSFFGQLIQWPDETCSIRLGYWRRRAGEDAWHFGSQMTLEAEPTELQTLLEKTLAMKHWFPSGRNA